MIGQSSHKGKTVLTTLEKKLNETRRDALVSYYLGYVAPQKARGQPVNEEDLYEYLLIDTQVADEVETSYVAQAIASVQQYLYRLVMNSEKGRIRPEPSFVNDWRNSDSQYAVWAAGMQVQNYAENFISPVTRLEKSHYFADLESTLNQNRLDPDRVQKAVLAYLNQFEAVSNLYVLNGYIDQDNFKKAKYYFVGRTTTKPYQYYWREMDLNKNEAEPADKAVTPNCWSDWLPIGLPLSGETVLEHTIRPVYYNNRLYITWAERDPTSQKDEKGADTYRHAYQIKFGYKRFDNTWTAPNTADLMGETGKVASRYLIKETADNFKLENVNTLSIVDFSRAPDDKGDANEDGHLLLGLFIYKEVKETGKDTSKNNPDCYAYLCCDSSFNRRTLHSDNRIFLFGTYQKNDGDLNNTGSKQSLQHALYQKEYKIVGNATHNSDQDKDPEDTKWFSKLPETIEVSVEKGFTLKITAELKEEFNNIFVFSGGDLVPSLKESCGFGLTHISDDLKFASLQYKDDDYYYFHNTAISYQPANFGVSKGKIPAGTYQFHAWSTSTQAPPAISGNYTVNNTGEYISLNNPSPTGMWVDISGQWLERADVWISESAMHPQFWYEQGKATYGCLQQIKNINKIQDTKKYRHFIRLEWKGGESLDSTHHEMFALSAPDSFSLSKNIQSFDFDEKAKNLIYTVHHGVEWKHCTRNIETEKTGQIYKSFTVEVALAEVHPHVTLPQIVSRYDRARGLVQYLAFNDSKDLPKDTRLNTTFARKLIKQANVGIDSLLTYGLQAAKLEADLYADNKSAKPMDFNGANGLYFWELFFHLPFLAAWRFASEQQYEPAQRWLHYIFDPSARKKEQDPVSNITPPDYWNVYPLSLPQNQVGELSRLLGDPLDPDTHAYADPVIYKKAVFIAYVTNLIAQGDAWYRQLTRDGLTAARVYYNQAAELLGARPDVTLVNRWHPASLETIAKAYNTALREHEQQLGKNNAVLRAQPGRNHSTLRLLDNPYFIPPLNNVLLAHWDTLAARLYNLRHNLTLDGKPLSLALYATPANPLTLLTQRAQQGTLAGGVSGAVQVIPPYRFRAVLPRAYHAVETLSRFGETLLSLLERGERARQEELQQQQMLDLSCFAVTLQQSAIDGLVADCIALQASRQTVQQRHDHYHDLYQQNISSGEQQVMDLHTEAQVALLAAQPMQIAGGAASLAPNIFGFSDGGSQWGAPLVAAAAEGTLAGEIFNITADRIATTENYRRRREEWGIQYQQAQKEIDAIDQQLAALAVRKQAAQTALQQSQAQQQRLQAMLTFLKTRFTQATLYQWLSGQLSALYYQAYDAVLALCLSAQACWQYEMGDFDTIFIQTGAWNDSYRGLQVGETLTLNLHQMEVAYLSRHERRLNISRTVSLKTLLDDAKKRNATLKDFKEQKAKGCFEFDLTEKLFDNDYPGHYLRQIQRVSVTLPTLMGPYQDVKAVLTQTKSSTLLKAEIEGVKYLNNSEKGNGNHVVNNLRPNQQVAISSGLNDAGNPEVRFDDERYLPFEGTGAVSSWTLIFPRAVSSPDGKLQPNPEQRTLLEHLDDVLVQVHYSACDSNDPSFVKKVEESLIQS